MSRICANTLVRCMPSSCLVNADISAMNGSLSSSLISSSRDGAAGRQQVGNGYRQRVRQPASDDSVGVAFSFSIFET